MAKYPLTQGYVDSLTCAAGKAKHDVFDTKQTGLVVTISPNGKKTYSIRTKGINNNIIHKKIGDAKVMTLEQARERIRQLLQQLSMGIDPFKPVVSIKTFQEFSQDYLEYVQSYKRSWGTDETLLRNHLLPFFANKKLNEVVKSDIIKFLNQFKLTHKPGSTNRILVQLRYMFNLALRWDEGIDKNPTAGIPKLEENNKKDRYLSSEEAQHLLAILRESDNKLLHYIVSALLMTGARKREILDAKWSEFDFDKNLWRVSISKSGKARYIPISSSLKALLDSVPRIDGCDYVFANPDTGKPFVQIYCSWDTARKRAGLPEVRIHDLRHSFASFMVNNGRTLYEVQKILGHTQIKTTQRYAHLSPDTLLDAANSVGNMMAFMQPAANDCVMQTQAINDDQMEDSNHAA
jgi:integrase